MAADTREPPVLQRHTRRGTAGGFLGAGRDAEACGRCVPAGRNDAQQRRHRVQGLHSRCRSAARRATEPGGHRPGREAHPEQADPVSREHTPAQRSHRRTSHVHAHRGDHHHALEKLAVLHARRVELRPAYAQARHSVVVAADGDGGRLLLRAGHGELRVDRRIAEPESLLCPAATSRRWDAHGVSPERAHAHRSRPL